jgi:hypothetical protein
MTKDKDNSRVINMHVPKTGGTTLLVLFRTWFGNKVVRKNDWPKPSDYRYKVLSGHFPYNPEYCNFHWVTFVRHPISRLESFYRYKQMKLRNKPGASDYWVPFFRGKTMEEWLDCAASKNLMTKQFAGRRPQEKLVPGDLRRALAAIDNFWFIGLQEQYTQDVTTLAEMLGTDVGKIPHHLKTAEPSIKIYDHHYGNEDDLELYNYVKEKRNIS